MAIDLQAIAPRRRWPWFVAGLIFVAGGLWTAAWHYAADKAETAIAGWRAREAKAGRIYACATQTIGGFPFRIDIHCSGPSAEFRSAQPPATVKWKNLHIVASVFSPTRLVAEFTGPMTVAEPGRLPMIAGDWKRASVTMEGLPTAPERITLAFGELRFERLADGGNEPLFRAKSGELVGRLIEGTVMRNPVIELQLKLNAAVLPKQGVLAAASPDVAGQALDRLAAAPVDADITALLRGLRNFAPKSWEQRFREIEAAGGRLEVIKARVQRGDVISLTSGRLGLSPRGRLHGELRMTIVQIDKLFADLGLDRLLEQATAPGTQLGAMIDRLPPQLGDIVRQRAAPAVIAGVNALGEPAELEGKKARIVPLRFLDGVVSIGPIPLGRTPPLF
jgi:hypothetical protein